MFKILYLLSLFWAVYGQEEGERCFHNGGAGTCMNLRKCPSAQKDLKNRIIPMTCGYDGLDSIVCCNPGNEGTTPSTAPVATTPKVPWTTTRRYRPMVYDYKDKNGVVSKGCGPIPAEQTSKRTGQRAWDKCIEYQETLLYPCKRSVALAGGQDRDDNCMHNAEELIIGGANATLGEFPHMVLLGFGTYIPRLSWECGGALLSHNYVLTAGHCTVNKENVTVSYALVGILNKTEDVDQSKMYKVLNIIKHPDYRPPTKYHDIALLEIEKIMPLTPMTVPACLHIGDRVKDDAALATGWGLTKYKSLKSIPTTLQKVTIQKFSQADCEARYPVNRRYLPRAFDISTQMCYGDKTEAKDTCQGDSGGPLQIKSKEIHCMYTIIGVTSFGNACGFSEDPGVYTRVAPYVSWIEDVVWPNH